MSELAKALLGAQKHIDAITKDASNSFHKYRYASGEGVIAAARVALHQNGLSVSRHRARIVIVGDYYMLRCVMRLTHDSGETRDDSVMFPIVPEKGRPLDKAAAGSLTTSLGYYLRDLLCVPRTDEQVEVCSRDDSTYVPSTTGGPKVRAAQALKGWTGMDGDDLRAAVTTAFRCVGFEFVPGQDVSDEMWEKLYNWVRGNKDRDFVDVVSDGKNNSRINDALLGSK